MLVVKRRVYIAQESRHLEVGEHPIGDGKGEISRELAEQIAAMPRYAEILEIAESKPKATKKKAVKPAEQSDVEQPVD